MPVVPVEGQWMIKCGKAMREMVGRAHLMQSGRRLRGDKVIGLKETGGRWERKRHKGGRREGTKASGVKATQDSQEMGWDAFQGQK